MTEEISLVWFRRDLRVADNPALWNSSRTVLPVYILEQDEQDKWLHGAAARWWLHHSLKSLARSLRDLGLPLVLRSGDPVQLLPELAKECGASTVLWNRRYEPAGQRRDEKVEQRLRENGVKVHHFKGNLLFEPWEATHANGSPYKEFEPFWEYCLASAGPKAKYPLRPLSAPREQRVPPRRLPHSEALGDWKLCPRNPDWAVQFLDYWTPGEKGARLLWNRFLEDSSRTYDQLRHSPASEAASMLSPHLSFGEISTRSLWVAMRITYFLDKDNESSYPGPEAFLKQLGVREFNYHLLHYSPEISEQSLPPPSSDPSPHEDSLAFNRWKQGRTGHPLLDAGLRELLHTGYMHGSLRMLTAAFLTGDLQIPWQRGAQWFWDALVDADLANNSAGWQWAGGCGSYPGPQASKLDPNELDPVVQSLKLDSEARYIRRWVPELRRLPDLWMRVPWKATPEVLREAGFTLGKDYPTPIAGAEDTPPTHPETLPRS